MAQPSEFDEPIPLLDANCRHGLSIAGKRRPRRGGFWVVGWPGPFGVLGLSGRSSDYELTQLEAPFCSFRNIGSTLPDKEPQTFAQRSGTYVRRQRPPSEASLGTVGAEETIFPAPRSRPETNPA